MNGNSHIKQIIALTQVKGKGPVFIKRNLLQISNELRANKDLAGLFAINVVEFRECLLHADSILEECKTENISVVSIVDTTYPQSLFELKDPPPVLFFKGNINLINKAVAIIGTRKSTETGNKLAERIGAYFGRDWAICNGLVEGIDMHSIVQDGQVASNVIGVLAGGLNVEYTCSKTTRELANKVLSNNGLLLSEFEPSRKEDRFSGSKASRIQAGLSKSVILVQSSLSGGSKYTLKAFSVLARPLAIVDIENNNEYSESPDFEANRMIAIRGRDGISKFCDIPKIEDIKITEIIRFHSNNDYKNLEEVLRRESRARHLFDL